jgi:hypothetical protein
MYNTVTVGNTATLIIGDNAKRLSLIITNVGTPTIYVGQDANVTTANGIPIVQYGSLKEDSGGQKVYCGPFYGICATSSDVRYWERER